MGKLNLTIPTDENDFILLKCPKCGEYFKFYADDFKNRIKIDIH